MSFTVEDFQDLLRLLDQHPDWLAELRRRLLTDELLELPALVRRIGEHLDALTARVDALTVRVDALTARVDALAEAQVRTEQQLAVLTARVDALAEAQARTEQRLDRLTTEVGGLRGEAMELRYRARAGAYFSSLARRLRVMDHTALADLLDDALDSDILDADERSQILLADLVLTGRRREDRVEIYLLAEISGVVDPHDVARAAERAALLAKLGRPVVPIVAGQSINADAEALAQQRGVWTVLDGHDIAPATASSS